jgi:hypothetical protein
MRTDDLGVARHLAEPRERGVVIDADGVDVTLHPYEAAQRLLKYLAKEILGAGWIVGDDFLNHRFSVTRYGRPEEGLHHVPEEVAEHGEEAIRANLEAFKATLGG